MQGYTLYPVVAGVNPAKAAHHSIVFRDEFSYCAHAHAAVVADGTWLVVFNRTHRREHTLHPPEDPLFRNVLIRSGDQGRSWSAPEVVPGYELSGTECASLTVLRNGRILLNQWQFEWYPLGLARHLPDQAALTYPEMFMKGWLNSPEHDVGHLAHLRPDELAPWVRGGGRTLVSISDDNGQSFRLQPEINVHPFSGGYGMRGAVELPDSSIILPLSDIPNYKQVFAIRSIDGGRSWLPPHLIAARQGHEFEEPAIICCPSEKLLVILRDNAARRLHQTESMDGGFNWTTPHPLPVEGYPAHLLLLGDGKLLMTYGWRQPGYAIHAVLSHNEGKTWDTGNTISIRSNLPNRNLGYPVTIPAGNSELFTVYYAEDSTGCTCIMGTRWSL